MHFKIKMFYKFMYNTLIAKLFRMPFKRNRIITIVFDAF